MTEPGADHGSEHESPDPNGLGIELAGIPLVRDMTVSDLQAIVDTILETIELPSWIEPGKIVANVGLSEQGVARIRLIMFTYLEGEQQEVARDEFKKQLSAALGEQQAQWNIAHP